MSEHTPEEQPGGPDVVSDLQSTVQETEPVRTGVEGVDAVLRSVEDLEGTPLEEHVAVFERAHEQLRGALDADS